MNRIFGEVVIACLVVCLAQAKDTTKPVKLYILAGQSNAEGRGNPEFVKKNFPELASQRDDIWHFRSPIKVPGAFMGPNYTAYGLEFKAGLVLGDAVDNDMIFITSAVGGTMLHTAWRPPSAVKRAGGEVGELYNNMIRQVHGLMANLTELYPRYKGQGYELAGFIWMQGENDCCAGTQIAYRDNLMDFIKDVRADFGVPNLPFCISKINDSCWGPPAIEIWAAEEYAAHNCKNVVVINTRDLRSLCHYDSESYLTIGDRIGKALLPFCKKPVHVGDKDIREAARQYFARTQGKGEKQDMTSLKNGLVGYWKFDELEGAEIKSGLEGGAQGKMIDGARIKGKIGKAVKMTTMQKIEFVDYKDPVNDKGQIENMSIAFWGKTPVGQGEHRIGKGIGQGSVAKGRMNSGNWFISANADRLGWDVQGFDWDGLVGFTAVVDNGGSNGVFASSSHGGFASDGIEWNHIVIVYDGRNQDKVRFYKNGKSMAIVASTIKQIKSGPIKASTTPLMIGGLELKYPESNFHAYDELAIWSRSLTDVEIKKLYNNGEGAEITVP